MRQGSSDRVGCVGERLDAGRGGEGGVRDWAKETGEKLLEENDA